MTIDIGAEAKDRGTSFGATYTVFLLDNPANESGEIKTVEVWANLDLTNFRVGTFYLVSGTTYKCRGSAALGNVSAGSKKTFTNLSITVEAGDYIGYYCDAGSIEADSSGFAGLYYKAGEYIDPADEATYALFANYTCSLYGSSVAAVVARSFGYIIG